MERMDSGCLLLVDDTPANLDVLREYLKERGYRILVAKDGETALTRAKAAHPDLVLLDVMMPGIDGFETCRRLKSDPDLSDIPVIFMTALSSPEHKVRGFEVGAIDYVTKPLERAEVIARVDTHVKKHRYETQLERLIHQRTQQLQDALQKLGEHDRRKVDFIRIISHELRTPLSVIHGYAGMLAQIDSSGANTNVINGLQSGTERMREIINEIMEVAWLDANSLPVNLESVDLRRVVDQVVELWKDAAVERRLRIMVNLNLPIIQADPDHISKVLEHLLLNAIKFTPDGGQINMNGCVTADRKMVEISVIDTGIGVDPKEAPLIFDKFYRCEPLLNHSSGKTKFKGAGPGLGLTIVKGLVEAHGGSVWVTSSGCDECTCPGSTFTFRLPISQPQIEQPNQIGPRLVAVAAD